MGNYNFQNTGGTFTFRYNLGECHDNALTALELQPSCSWLTVKHDTIGLVTFTASNTNAARECDVKVTINGKECSDKLLHFSQGGGRTDCSCFSIINVENIPSDGLSKGSVIGNYTIDSTCNEDAISYHCAYPKVELKNGQIILAEDVEENLSTSEGNTFVLNVYFGDDTATPCVEQKFYQSIAGCNCQNIFSFVAPVHIFFSNLDESAGAGYTQLKDVLVASATTDCGEFKAISTDMEMLSSTVKGQNVEDKVLMEEADGVTYAYITVNPQTEFERTRSAVLNIFFKEKNTDEYLECSEYIEIYQSSDNYWKCGTKTYTIDDLTSSTNYYYNLAECATINNEVSFLSSMSGTLLPLHTRLGYGNELPNTIIKINFDSMFYVKNIESVQCGGFYSSDNDDFIAYKIPASEPRNVYNPTNYEDEYTLTKGSTSYSYNFKFTKENDGSNGFKVISLSYDLYTEYNAKYNLSGIFCQTIGKINLIQSYEGCSSCALKKATDVFIDDAEITKYTRYEKSGIIPESIFLCGGHIIDIRLEDTSYGEITLHKDSDGYVQTYDIILYENDTSSNRIIKIIQKVRFDDGTECENLYLKYEKLYNLCDNCQKLMDSVTYRNYVSDASYANGSECSSTHVTSEYFNSNSGWLTTSTISTTFSHIVYDETLTYCYDIFFVLCKKDGSDEFLSDGEFTTDCGVKLKYNGYVANKGEQITDFFDSMSVYVEDANNDTILNHFFKLKFYEKGSNTLACESEVKFFSRKLSIINCYPIEGIGDKTYYLDKVFYSNITIDNSFETEVNNDNTYVKLPLKDETYTIYHLPVENGSNATKSTVSYPLCDGYKINYVINTTSTDNISPTISGKDIIVVVRNTSSLTPGTRLTLDLSADILETSGAEYDKETIKKTLYLLFE